MDEAAAGIIPLQGQGESAFEDDPDFNYSMTADQGQVTGLWNVTVTVTKPKSSSGVQTTLSKVILDPTIIGSTQDSSINPGSDTSSAATGATQPSTHGAAGRAPSQSP